MTTPQKTKVTITYCIGCNWMLRAAWMAQELLSTFQDLLGSVTLVPGEVGGIFEISVNDELIWERKRDGGFPDVKELKTACATRSTRNRISAIWTGPKVVNRQK